MGLDPAIPPATPLNPFHFNMVLPSSCYLQTYPTDNATAVLVNLFKILDVPVSPGEVEQKVYGHKDFPFISMQHLADFLISWQFNVRIVRISPSVLEKVRLPAIAYTSGKGGAFVLVHSLDGENLSYLHPATGWVTESLATFSQTWTGVLMEIAAPDSFALTPQEPIPRQRAAIAVTLTNAEATLDSFIRYHLGTGFDHIFLFLDKQDDAGALTEWPGRLTVIRRDSALEERWGKCRLYPQLGDQIDRPEVRQLLNVELSVHLALEQKLDWLLQIDGDELFYSPYQSVQAHFHQLAAQQVYHTTYLNYEAITEVSEVEDYFKEVTLFKKNPAILNKEQLELLLQHFRTDTNNGFLAYSNGKSAARVEENLLPWGNHHFQLLNDRVQYQKKYKLVNEVCAEPPVILHYTECGFGHFLKKYETWGQFPDRFLGGQSIAELVPFRTSARDIVQTGDKKRAWEFYEDRVVCQDHTIVEQLLKEEVLCRIKDVSHFLQDTE